MTAVTAKVTCTSKNEMEWGTSLSFSPDYADGRNAEWAAATPSLSLSMTVKNDVAVHFEKGAHYTLTFERDADETPQHAED